MVDINIIHPWIRQCSSSGYFMGLFKPKQSSLSGNKRLGMPAGKKFVRYALDKS
jgi:hypothetical protein